MPTSLHVDEARTLNTGAAMPALGLGVYQMPPGPATEELVLQALAKGYRHIDTASFYGNERDVGNAIRRSGLRRDELFVTSKLWPTGFVHPEAAFRASLDRLGLAYLDLYLIHWPFPLLKGRAWKALERLQERGIAKAVGVSSYSVADLEGLLKAARIVPAVNQVEFSPFRFQKSLLEYCQGKGIQLEAYSPLTRGKRLADPRLAALAAKYGKSPAQVLIRWSLQHGIVVIPKTANPKRLDENRDVFGFEISEDDMRTLDGFDEGYRALFR